MKKSVLKKFFLIMLPAMAVLLAASVDSVTVLDSARGVVETYSYFDLIPVENLQICGPLAAILAAVSTALAVIFVVTGKNWSAAGLLWTSLISATVATVPVVFRGEILVVPHVGLPILMMIDCVLAYTVLKKPEPEKKRTIDPKLRRK